MIVFWLRRQQKCMRWIKIRLKKFLFHNFRKLFKGTTVSKSISVFNFKQFKVLNQIVKKMEKTGIFILIVAFIACTFALTGQEYCAVGIFICWKNLNLNWFFCTIWNKKNEKVSTHHIQMSIIQKTFFYTFHDCCLNTYHQS